MTLISIACILTLSGSNPCTERYCPSGENEQDKSIAAIAPNDERVKERVRLWLARNSYEMRWTSGRHIVPPRPVMDWGEWIAEGKRIPDVDAVLDQLLITQDKGVERLAVIESLGWLGSSHSVPVLIDVLYSKEARVRLEAVCALGRLQDERALEPLGRLLNGEPDKSVRANIVTALESINASKSRAYLERAAMDESAFVSDIAKETLRRIELKAK